MIMNKLFLMTIVALAACSCSGNGSKSTQQDSTMATDDKELELKIETTMGDIEVKLYGDTPQHRDNMARLAREGYYDGLLFHRVIEDFMVQAGDPDSRSAAKGQMLGSGDPGYTIPAEIVYPRHFHRRGALSAARTGDQVNPERRSSGSQFYIVTGKVYTDSTINQLEQQLRMMKVQEIFNRLQQENHDRIMTLRRNRDKIALEELRDLMVEQAQQEAASLTLITPEQRLAYTTVGGTPHLDGQYTVFGEVTSGMDVVDAIQRVATDNNDRPLEDVKIIRMSVIER